MNDRLGHILALAKKEWLQIRRDILSLLLAIWMPLILLLLFGTAITLDIKNIPLVILDDDMSALSREIKDRLTSSKYFILKRYISNPSEIDSALDSGDAKIALWFPGKFTDDFNSRRQSSFLVTMDGADNNTARVASGYFQTLLENLSSEITQFRAPVRVSERVWFNTELNSTNFLIPGLMGIIILITCTVLTALSIVREKEQGTIEKLKVTPLKPVDIIIGKMLPYFVIALISFIIMLSAGIFIFKIPFRGNLLLLFFSALISILTGLLYGLFISSLTNSQQVAWMVSMLSTLLPSMILSGFVFLIPSMPAFLQAITYLVPARYIISAMRGIILKGNGFFDLIFDFIPLLIISSGLVYFSGRAMRKRL
jgi:ABC-2 type transport system permease protein